MTTPAPTTTPTLDAWRAAARPVSCRVCGDSQLCVKRPGVYTCDFCAKMTASARDGKLARVVQVLRAYARSTRHVEAVVMYCPEALELVLYPDVEWAPEAQATYRAWAAALLA